MTRKVPEWIAKSDDDKVPPRVQLRVFEAYGGKDYLTGQIIRPGDKWELDHITALANGGEHREGNLAPILPINHKGKTRADLALKKKNERIRKKHRGITRPKGRIQSRGFGWGPSNTRELYGDLDNG